MRRRAGQSMAMARPFLGLDARGEKEEEREQQVAEGVFMLQGGARERGERGESTGARRPWRQCFPWRHSERGEMTGGSPPVRDFSFSILQKFQ